MSNYPILVWIFIIEAALTLFLISAIALHRLIFFFIHRAKGKRKKILSAYFLECIEKHRAFDEKSYKGKRRWHKELLEVLETFNVRFHGNEWEDIKQPAAQKFLLPKARKWARSWFWMKRNCAARSFALCPMQKDEKLMLRLMDDRKFLVKHKATIAAIELESPLGITKALFVIKNEPGSSSAFTRDALIKASHNAAKKMIAAGSEPALRLACLDVLSSKSWALPIPFLEKDLQSKSSKIRRLAIKTLICNPLPDCIDILLSALKDDDEEIRIEAARGLQIYSPLIHFDPLETALSDPSWFVRIEAARALKQLGAKGIAILKKDKDAKKYIEDFP